jgi:NAD(P)H-dependent flavin oxidoreductase YrpB (nitropropane dioxygenase family)
MGTRFLMTRDCPVPEPTKARYVAASTDDILVTTKIDGLPQRMIRNAMVAKIESAGRVAMLKLALESAMKLKRLTGARLSEMLASARQMGHQSDDGYGAALMAAIAPVLFQRSMVAGLPDEGLIATGQVAGRLQDLPSCAELIERIVNEARERLAALADPWPNPAPSVAGSTASDARATA